MLKEDAAGHQLLTDHNVRENTLRKEKICRIGATGHRLFDDLDQVRSGVIEAFSMIRHAFPDCSLVIVSPLAEGADRLVAECGLQIGGRLLVPLPLPLPIYQARFSSDEARSVFARLLAQADAVIDLPPQADRHQAYHAVGQYVVDHCDALIAVWDGQEAQGIGGTGEVVAYARDCGKPLLIVHAVNGNHGLQNVLPQPRTKPGSVTSERFGPS